MFPFQRCSWSNERLAKSKFGNFMLTLCNLSRFWIFWRILASLTLLLQVSSSTTVWRFIYLLSRCFFAWNFSQLSISDLNGRNKQLENTIYTVSTTRWIESLHESRLVFHRILWGIVSCYATFFFCYATQGVVQKQNFVFNQTFSFF